jgi:hypothetical protein
LYWLRSQVSIQKALMRTMSFCSRPIEPETSITWKITAELSGCGQLLRAR